MPDAQFTALGNKVTEYAGLEVFSRPSNVVEVTLKSDELVSFCPITHQPDVSSVVVTYWPKTVVIETKSFKLFLNSFREQGIFAEEMAHRIAQEIYDATQSYVEVELTQHPRGGITTVVVARIDLGE